MKNLDTLPFELRKLGLGDKESKVYLLALEMGQFSAQKISTKTDLSRPTIYRVLKDLEKRKLISKFQKDKKKFFSVNSPDQFLSVLKIERRKAEEKEREFLRIISILQTKFSQKESNDIKIFQGTKGKKSLFEKLSTTHSDEIFVLFFCEKKLERKSLQKTYEQIKSRRGRVAIKELHFGKTPISHKNSDFVQSKTILSQALQKNSTGALIVSKRIFILERERGLLIENKDVVEIVRSLLQIIWNQA